MMGWIVGRQLVAVLAATLCAVPAAAQTSYPDPRNFPSGSPLRSDQPGSYQQGQGQGPQDSSSDDTRSRQNSAYSGSPQNPVSIGPTQIVDTDRNLISADRLNPYPPGGLLDNNQLRQPPRPGEFEQYVARLLGRKLPRFGANLLLPSNRDFATPATASVPPDYALNVGDVVSIAMTGSIEGSVERQIDSDGAIFLPKVGAIHLAGVRYGDLKERVSAAIGRQYRGYSVSVAIRRLRGIRVYVTGFANNPGAFTVSSLSTIANAVFSAGGPNSGGSFRSVKLYRHGAEVADFDIYQLVRGGNRLEDAVLQNEDVLFIPPVGPQVAVIGSVNEEAIYEARPGESVETLVGFAGGPNSLGDASRVILYRTSDPKMVGAQQIDRTQSANTPVAGADIIQLLSQGTLAQPMERQSVLVRIEGEVNRPGNYYVPPNTPLADILNRAGGLTPRAYAFGTKLTRLSVQNQQRESYQEALKQLELSLAASSLTPDPNNVVQGSDRQAANTQTLLDRLRRQEPDGRVILDISPAATTLPGDILVENNDSITVPPRATTVGVFGAVYRAASFFIDRGRPLRVRDYIERAGGVLRAADQAGVFVVRANGAVLSRRRGALTAPVLPGDVIFVPIKTQSNNFWARLRDITAVIGQIGLGAATINAIR